MGQRGQPELCLDVDAPDLAEQLRDRLERLDRDADEVVAGIRATLPRELEALGRMGIAFEDRLRLRYPDFPRRDVPRDWRNYLPPLSAHLEELL